MAAAGLVLLTLIMALFMLVMLRPALGRTLSPRSWIIGGGLALPIPVLVLLLSYSFAQGERLLLVGDGAGNPTRIEARSRMWQWEFFYLDHQGSPTTIDTLHIPVGVPVEIVATSEDVIHSFWVPRLAGKVDATPGHASRLRLLADTPGTYYGACAEFCGSGHTAMLFTVRAHASEEFNRIIEGISTLSGPRS